MIEDEKIGLKIAENKEEAMAVKTLEQIEENNRQMLFQVELNKVMITYLNSKVKRGE